MAAANSLRQYHQYLLNFKSSLCSLEGVPNMEAVTPNFPHLINPRDDPNFLLAPTQHQPEFPAANLGDNFPGFLDHHHHRNNNKSITVVPPASELTLVSPNKRKSVVDAPQATASASSSSPSFSAYVINTTRNSSGKGKRVKTSNEKKVQEKPKQVVHVRARRGQATDSHSLAERVRRGKINEKLKCLQTIVPGCYKTMGMAGMLDEIINYVQSLQNQVEFLSMKLTAASTFHDFNSDTDIIDEIQRAKAYEEAMMKMQKLSRQGHEEQGLSASQVGAFDLSFGCYNPPLPPYHHT